MCYFKKMKDDLSSGNTCRCLFTFHPNSYELSYLKIIPVSKSGFCFRALVVMEVLQIPHERKFKEEN